MTTLIPERGREPGIFLHMPAEEHRADPAIGGSGYGKMTVSMPEFQYRWSGNAARVADPDTDSKNFGSAVHRLVLEGPESLQREFICEPVGPDVLNTMDDLRAALKSLGMAVSGSKDALIERLRPHVAAQQFASVTPRWRIYNDIVDTAKARGKKVLKPDAWARIMIAGQHITANPALSKSFSNGKSEISVFWQRDGIRKKARFDYLRAVVMGHVPTAVVSDLKSFAAPREVPVERQIDNACGSYLKQAAHYLEGFEAMVGMLAASEPPVTDANADELAWLKRFTQTRETVFAFVFYKNTGAPYSAGRIILPDDPLIKMANDRIAALLAEFRRFYETFGPDGPWINCDEPSRLTEDNIKPWSI